MIYQDPICTFPGRYDIICESNGKSLREYLRGKNLRVLDIGCSVGVETARLAFQNPQHSFTGLDIRPELIKIANSGLWSITEDLIDYKEKWDENNFPEVFQILKHGEGTLGVKAQNWDSCPYLKLKKYPLSNLNYVVGDYGEIKFPKESFDLIFGFICGVDRNQEKVMPNLMRLLVDNGILVTERSIFYKNYR